MSTVHLLFRRVDQYSLTSLSLDRAGVVFVHAMFGNFLGSGAGFWEFNYAGFFFCVDAIDGAQQCSVLQVISGDIDGIIHRHSLLLRGVRMLVLFVLRVIGCCNRLLYQVLLKFSQRAAYNYYFIHIFTETKIILCSTRFEHAEFDSTLPDHARAECHVDRYRFKSHPTCDRGEFSISPFESAQKV